MLGVALDVALVLADEEDAGEVPVPAGSPAHPVRARASRAEVVTARRRVGRGRDVADSTRRRYVTVLRTAECTNRVLAAGRAEGTRRASSPADGVFPTLDRPWASTASAMIDPMPSLPVVLDVDTGVDDACALLLAALHPRLDLRAVTCVGGNAPLADVVRNTLVVLETAGRGDVPVGVGAAPPVPRGAGRRAPRARLRRHGRPRDAAPEPATRPPPGDRPPARHHRRRRRPPAHPVTVVPLAPMTNLALLARVHPQAFARIGRIVFMGGGVEISNATAAAEFNVFHDPEAAAMVLAACAEHDVPVTMYGLDVFYDPLVTDVQVDGPARGRHPGGAPRRRPDLVPPPPVRQRGGDDRRRRARSASSSSRMPCALERLPVRVELAGTWTRGRTVVDRRDWSGDLAHDPHGLAATLVDVALGIDGPRIADLWLRTVRGEAS